MSLDNLMTKTDLDDYTNEVKNYIANSTIQSTEKGVANGVATLDSNGKVPASQIDVQPGGGSDDDNKSSINVRCKPTRVNCIYNTPKIWNGGPTYMNGEYIWTDGTNIYYSHETEQYILDKTTSTWNPITWNYQQNYSDTINGNNVWTDGTNIYHSYTSTLIFDKSTNTWNGKTWTDGFTIFTAEYIWTSGNDIIYSNGSQHYVLDKSTSTWTTISMHIDGGDEYYISPEHIWNMGNNTYLSVNGQTYQGSLWYQTFYWSPCIWGNSEYIYINGSDIWTDGTSYYCGNNYRLNTNNNTWEQVEIRYLNSSANIMASNIWTDGTNTYYSYQYTQWVLDKSTLICTTKTWNGLPGAFLGEDIWSDGTNIYLTGNIDNHYVLDKTTSTWVAKTWNNAPTNFNPRYVWTDGTNTYYSAYNDHYILDVDTSTWIAKNWGKNFYGTNIWRYERYTYLSINSSNYVLSSLNNNPINNYWSTKTWNGLTNITANYVWSDGTNLYHKSNYMLDINTSTWKSISFFNLNLGQISWTDGTNLYAYYNYKNYVLDKAGLRWVQIDASPNLHAEYQYIWSDGANIYYSFNKNHYTLDLNNIPRPEFELPEVTSDDNGKFLCVVDGSWAADTVPSAESQSF